MCKRNTNSLENYYICVIIVNYLVFIVENQIYKEFSSFVSFSLSRINNIFQLPFCMIIYSPAFFFIIFLFLSFGREWLKITTFARKMMGSRQILGITFFYLPPPPPKLKLTKKSSAKSARNVKTQNPTKGGVAFFGICGRFPLITVLSSKCHNFFSIWSLLSLEKYVSQQFSLYLFSKFFWSLSVSHYFLPPFFKQLSIFCLKSCILVGKRQTTKIF